MPVIKESIEVFQNLQVIDILKKEVKNKMRKTVSKYRTKLLARRMLPKFLNFLSDRVITSTPELSLHSALFF
jgi:hypothetical protein